MRGLPSLRSSLHKLAQDKLLVHGADERTRTSTLLTAQPPQGCVYTISPHPHLLLIAHGESLIVGKLYQKAYLINHMPFTIRHLRVECPGEDSNLHAFNGTGT